MGILKATRHVSIQLLEQQETRGKKTVERKKKGKKKRSMRNVFCCTVCSALAVKFSLNIHQQTLLACVN